MHSGSGRGRRGGGRRGDAPFRIGRVRDLRGSNHNDPGTHLQINGGFLHHNGVCLNTLKAYPPLFILLAGDRFYRSHPKAHLGQASGGLLQGHIHQGDHGHLLKSPSQTHHNSDLLPRLYRFIFGRSLGDHVALSDCLIVLILDLGDQSQCRQHGLCHPLILIIDVRHSKTLTAAADLHRDGLSSRLYHILRFRALRHDMSGLHGVTGHMAALHHGKSVLHYLRQCLGLL